MTTSTGFVDAILNSLKHNAKDPLSNVMRVTSTNLLFMLLDRFAQQRNKQAPIIYKALTFMLIEFYDNNELREEMLKNFMSLFARNQSIPIRILLDPLLQQIKINLDR